MVQCHYYILAACIYTCICSCILYQNACAPFLSLLGLFSWSSGAAESLERKALTNTRLYQMSAYRCLFSITQKSCLNTQNQPLDRSFLGLIFWKRHLRRLLRVSLTKIWPILLKRPTWVGKIVQLRMLRTKLLQCWVPKTSKIHITELGKIIWNFNNFVIDSFVTTVMS